MRPIHLKAPIAVAGLFCLLSACSQDEGESCQHSGDCADGLVCEIAAKSERGTCEDPAEQRDAGNPDAGDEPPINPDEAGPMDEDGG